MALLSSGYVTALPPPIHYAAYTLAKSQGETRASRILASAVRAAPRGEGEGKSPAAGEGLGSALQQASEARRKHGGKNLIDLLV